MVAFSSLQIPFFVTELSVIHSCQEILEQKTGAVQNSPPDKTAPEPSPWSPVMLLQNFKFEI